MEPSSPDEIFLQIADYPLFRTSKSELISASQYFKALFSTRGEESSQDKIIDLHVENWGEIHYLFMLWIGNGVDLFSALADETVVKIAVVAEYYQVGSTFMETIYSYLEKIKSSQEIRDVIEPH